MKLLNLVDLPKRTSMLKIISESQSDRDKDYLKLDDEILQQIHSPWNKEQILDWAAEYIEEEASFGDGWRLETEDEKDNFLFCLEGRGDSDKIVSHRGDYYNPGEGRIVYSIDDVNLTIVDSNDKEYLFDITQDLQDTMEGVIYY